MLFSNGSVNINELVKFKTYTYRNFKSVKSYKYIIPISLLWKKPFCIDLKCIFPVTVQI